MEKRDVGSGDAELRAAEGRRVQGRSSLTKSSGSENPDKFQQVRSKMASPKRVPEPLTEEGKEEMMALFERAHNYDQLSLRSPPANKKMKYAASPTPRRRRPNDSAMPSATALTSVATPPCRSRPSTSPRCNGRRPLQNPLSSLHRRRRQLRWLCGMTTRLESRRRRS